MITQDTIDFLKDLAENNNRDWFQENKVRYQETQENFRAFVNSVRIELSGADDIERTKYYRIYRDLRFSKDKTPYKTHYAAHFTRSGKYRRGGFYVEISSEESWVGGGFWNPERQDLQYLRDGILSDPDPLREALSGKEVVARFEGLEGDELKTAPKGIDKDHPDVDLLRKKQFLLHRSYPLKEVLKENFYKSVAADFAAMIPVFDVLTDYLVYDGNGVER